MRLLMLIYEPCFTSLLDVRFAKLRHDRERVRAHVDAKLSGLK
jgi:hypothetical protein